MSDIVAKPFKTINRRFAVGDPVTAADIDPANVLSLDDYKAGDFIKSDVATPTPTPAASRTFGETDAH